MFSKNFFTWRQASEKNFVGRAKIFLRDAREMNHTGIIFLKIFFDEMI